MRTVINSTSGTIAAGRILVRTARSISVCSKILGGAAVDLRAGFPNLFPGAQGRITATCKGLVACRLALHGAGIMSHDALDLGAGNSAPQSHNVFTAPMRAVSTNIDPVGSIELTMDLDDAVVIATGAEFFGVSRTAAARDASFSAYTEGDVALIELAEASVTRGRFLVPDSQGRARYFDPMVDSIAIGQLTDPTVITVGMARYVRVMVAVGAP